MSVVREFNELQIQTLLSTLAVDEMEFLGANALLNLAVGRLSPTLSLIRPFPVSESIL